MNGTSKVLILGKDDSLKMTQQNGVTPDSPFIKKFVCPKIGNQNANQKSRMHHRGSL